MNPYDTLGVNPTASQAEIKRAYRKRAYRKRAKKQHPDGGGTAKQFHELSRAMLVLNDPAKREKFDRTGEIDEDAVDNTLAQAITGIVGFIAQAVSNSQNPLTLDLVTQGKKYFRQQQVEFENAEKNIRKKLDAFRKVEARFSGKGKAPLIKRALLAQIQEAQAPLVQLAKQIESCKAALAILDECVFAFDQPAPQSCATSTWRIAMPRGL